MADYIISGGGGRHRLAYVQITIIINKISLLSRLLFYAKQPLFLRNYQNMKN